MSLRIMLSILRSKTDKYQFPALIEEQRPAYVLAQKPQNEDHTMVIEYKGLIIRNEVANRREKIQFR